MVRTGLGAFCAVWAMACLGGCMDTETATEIHAMARYQELARTEWRQVFHDGCTGDWQDAWFLDGRKATVTNAPNDAVRLGHLLPRDAEDGR